MLVCGLPSSFGPAGRVTPCPVPAIGKTEKRQFKHPLEPFSYYATLLPPVALATPIPVQKHIHNPMPIPLPIPQPIRCIATTIPQWLKRLPPAIQSKRKTTQAPPGRARQTQKY